MIYTHAMQEPVIHHIAAANSLRVHPGLSSVYLRSCLMFGEITSRNVYLIQIYKHNQMSDLLDVEKILKVENSPVLTY